MVQDRSSGVRFIFENREVSMPTVVKDDQKIGLKDIRKRSFPVFFLFFVFGRFFFYFSALNMRKWNPNNIFDILRLLYDYL